MKDPKFYMIFIREKIEQLALIAGNDPFKSLKDDKTELAVERLLHIISDATKFIPDEQKALYPDIEWSKIAGFRNVIVHDYLGVSRSVLIDIIEKEIPLLRDAVKGMLKTHGL